MGNPFEAHNLHHLSASSINKWIAQPSHWVMTHLLKRKETLGAAVDRGIAVERGIEYGAFNETASVEDCQRVALDEYAKRVGFKPDPDKEKERQAIPAMVELGLDALDAYGEPSRPVGSAQHRIEVTFEGLSVPVIGYLDFLYDGAGKVVDLKTTHRIPTSISGPHARQGSIYKKAHGNYGMDFVYVSGKKSSILTLEDPDEHLNVVHKAALNMQRFLSLSKDAEELAALVPSPDPDSFYWRSSVEARREIYGY